MRHNLVLRKQKSRTHVHHATAVPPCGIVRWASAGAVLQIMSCFEKTKTNKKQLKQITQF